MSNKIISRLLVLAAFSVAYAAPSHVCQMESNQAIVATNDSRGVPVSFIKKNAPKYYVVKKSDTLVHLAQMYLTQMAYWSDLLGLKACKSSHLYPGQQLRLLSLGDKRVLLVASSSNAAAGRVQKAHARSNADYQKLKPQVRELAHEELPALPNRWWHNLLLDHRLMEPDFFESLPIVVASSEFGALMYSAGDTIYVKGLQAAIGSRVALYSKFRQLIDPDSHESLGYEILYVGEGVVTQNGSISSLVLTATETQIAPGDRVVALAKQPISLFVPHKSAAIISGKIIALYDSSTATAEMNSVVINRGSRDGVDVGQIYDVIDTRGVIDPTSQLADPEYLILPPEVSGEILIYKVYAKVSFGLVTTSLRPIEQNSLVQSQQ